MSGFTTIDDEPYAPFDRGPYPVGVRSFELRDPARGERPLSTELWYPAAPAYAGADLRADTGDIYRIADGFPALAQQAVRDAAPRPVAAPLLVFSHGWGGHRRQSTFLCTHLASHGFIVAAVDHAGNTLLDAMRSGSEGDRRGPIPVERILTDRPADVAVVIDRLRGGDAGEVGAHIDPRRLGVLGHSYGGWTALVAAGRDPRIGAVVALAPAGGPSRFGDDARLRAAMPPGWGRDVPALVVLADLDAVLPLAGMDRVLERIPSTKRVVVLAAVDHFHFLDRAAEVHEFMRRGALAPFDRIASSMRPFEALSPEAAVHRAVVGLAVAHMDAVLGQRVAAVRFLGGPLAAALATQGISADISPEYSPE
jgi:predicted dienelactone hydrolase